jgi:hypothetical protein
LHGDALIVAIRPVLDDLTVQDPHPVRLRHGERAVGCRELHGDVAVWTLNSPQVYDLLVNLRSWSLDDYEAWLAETLADALLGPKRRKRPS